MYSIIMSENPELDDTQRQTVINLWKKFQKINEAHNRPALYFTFKEYENPEEGIEDRFASKLGGHPFWPDDKNRFPYDRRTSLPENASGEEEEEELFWTSAMGDLRLLAQFNLSDISSSVTPFHLESLGLPTDGGILQFFVSSDDCWGQYGANAGYPSPTSYRVKYWPNDIISSTEKCLSTDHFPEISEEEVHKSHKKIIRNIPLPFSIHRPLKITFDRELKHDSWGFSDFNARDGFEKFLQQEAPDIVNHLCQPDPEKLKWKLCAVWEPLMEEVKYEDPAAGSKLGGHPCFTQDDPRRNWRQENCSQLLQLESKDGVMIGDCGIMHFFNSTNQFSRNTFDGVQYQWDCC